MTNPDLIPLDFDALYIGEKPIWTTRAKDPKTSGLEDMPDSLHIDNRYREKVCAVIDRIAETGLPRPGQQYRLITRRSFNAIEMLAYITKTQTITELKMAIYSLNFHAAQLLVSLIDSGKIETAEIMMSNLRNAAHRQKEEIVKEQFIRHPRITLWFCSSHAKLMACKTAQGNHYIIEGSGNHAYNSRIEQYVIDNDPQIYDFTAQWMTDIKTHLAGKKELVVF